MRKKRIISLLLSIVMTVGLFFQTGITVNAAAAGQEESSELFSSDEVTETTEDTETTETVLSTENVETATTTEEVSTTEEAGTTEAADTTEADLIEDENDSIDDTKTGSVTVDAIDELCSKHDYDNDTDKTWIYSVSGAAELKVKFSDDTVLENGADYIFLYDKYDNQIAKYTGTKLAGETFTIPYDTVKIRLVTDSSGTAYGFDVDCVTAMTGISVKIEPDITKYIVGQEEDFSGFELMGTFDDGTTQDIVEGYTFGKVNNNLAGVYQIVVSYRGLTTSFNVEFVEPVLTGIEIVSLPAKTTYSYGQELDLTGIEIVATDEEGNRYNIVDDYTVDGYDSMVTETQTLVVTYKEFTATFDIVVNYSFTYTILSGGITVTGLSDTSVVDLIIPDNIGGIPVVAISDSAFKNSTKLVNVMLGDNITSIGAYAFYSCKSLESINIPDGVTVINEYVFDGCSKLGKITLPSGVTKIGDSAFANCSSLGNAILPAGVINIGTYAFLNCTAMTEVIFPEGLKTISKGAYSGCSGITNLEVPDTVTSIGEGAFKGMGLVSIKLPFVGSDRGRTYGSGSVFGYIFGSVSSYTAGTITQKYLLTSSSTSLDKTEYYYIPTTLKTVEITDAEQIPAGAFYNCSGITDISINEGITSIGSYAFYNCFSLTSMELSEDIENIGAYAFCDCKSLESINIPDGVTVINEDVFGGCSKLGKITLPSGVTKIGDSAFANCSSLGNVILPAGVTSIGTYAFLNCTAMTEVIFPEGLKTISKGAYSGCSGITNLEVPDTVTSIGEGAFKGMGLVSIKLPFVGSDRGRTYGSGSVFGYIFGSVSSYTAGTITQKYLLTSSSMSLDKTEYYYIPTTLKTVEITDAKQIPAGAFYNCSGITDISINEGITSIGSYAFYDCISMDSIYFPDSLVSIESNAFNGCKSCLFYANKGTVGAEFAVSKDMSYYSTKKVELDKSELILYKGDSYTLAPTVTMLNGIVDSDAVVSWDTSDSSVVTVSDGRISVTGPGTATVTVTCQGCEATCIVTVYYLLEGISLDTESVSMDIGNTRNINVSYLPDNTTDDKTITWISSDENIATVSEDGTITGNLPGNAVITATSFNGLMKTVDVEVLSPITSIELDKTSLIMEKGSTSKLNVSYAPLDTTDTYKWSSSDTDVVSVDGDGNLIANGIGTATVKLTTSRNKEVSCTITVQISATDIEIGDTSKELFIDDIYSFNAQMMPIDTTDSITWSSSDTDVAEISTSGNLTLLKAGNTTITATTTSGVKAQCEIVVVNDITYTNIEISNLAYEYTGSAILPDETVNYGNKTLKKGTDYIVTYSSNTELGKGYITIKGIGRYSGTDEISFEIVPRTLTEDDVQFEYSNLSYTGNAIENPVSICIDNCELIEGIDYDIVYTDNVDAGTARVTITGKGNYIGTVEKTFTICQKSQTIYSNISATTIHIGESAVIDASGIGDIIYTSSDPEIVFVDSDGNIVAKNIGSTEIKVTASGNKNYEADSISYIITVYCDHDEAPVITTEYFAATCTEDGATEGKYCPTCGEILSVSETIPAEGHSWGEEYVVDDEATCTEDGSKSIHCEKCGEIQEGTVEVIKATGHNYAITSTTKATTTKNGSIVSECSNCGNKITTVIYYPKTITLSAAKYYYTGKAIHPSVKVTDASGNIISSSNYTVTYSQGCTNVGTYKVTVTFKGNYSGTVTKSFQIIKANQTISASNKNVVIGYKSVISAKITTGNGKLTYKVGNSNIATVSSTGVITAKGVGRTTITITASGTSSYNLTTKQIVVTVLPQNTSISKIGSSKNGTLTVLWPEKSGVTGYQLRYSLYSNMSGAKVISAGSSNATAKVISGLISGKKYYVQIRTYKTVGGTHYFSSWSGIKSATVLNAKINKTSAVTYVNQGFVLAVTGTNGGTVKWTSSNSKVATVSSNGCVIGRSAGTAIITATVYNMKFTCKVTVYNNQITYNVNTDQRDYYYGLPYVQLSKAYYKGSDLVVDLWIINKRVYKAKKFDYITLTIYDSNDRIIATYTFKNVSLNIQPYLNKKITLTYSGNAVKIKNASLRNGVKIYYSYTYTYSY